MNDQIFHHQYQQNDLLCSKTSSILLLEDAWSSLLRLPSEEGTELDPAAASFSPPPCLAATESIDWLAAGDAKLKRGRLDFIAVLWEDCFWEESVVKENTLSPPFAALSLNAFGSQGTVGEFLLSSCSSSIIKYSTLFTQQTLNVMAHPAQKSSRFPNHAIATPTKKSDSFPLPRP